MRQQRLLILLPALIASCSKGDAARMEREPAPAAAPAPAPAPATTAVPPLIAGTRVAWPTDAPGRWVGIAERGGMLRVVAGTANGAVRDVTGATFEDEYVEIDDTFQITPSGNTLIVARSMHKLTEAYREVFLLAADGGEVRVAQRWSGLEGQRAPFEPRAPQSPARGVDRADAVPRTVQVETRGGKARLVAVDETGRAIDVRGGTFGMDYDPESNTITYETVGSRVIARMSTAENIADNCETLLVAPEDKVPRVVERWRGDCAARAPFDRAP